jgi:hypothetical protein
MFYTFALGLHGKFCSETHKKLVVGNKLSFMAVEAFCCAKVDLMEIYKNFVTDFKDCE